MVLSGLIGRVELSFLHVLQPLLSVQSQGSLHAIPRVQNSRSHRIRSEGISWPHPREWVSALLVRQRDPKLAGKGLKLFTQLCQEQIAVHLFQLLLVFLLNWCTWLVQSSSRDSGSLPLLCTSCHCSMCSRIVHLLSLSLFFISISFWFVPTPDLPGLAPPLVVQFHAQPLWLHSRAFSPCSSLSCLCSDPLVLTLALLILYFLGIHSAIYDLHILLQLVDVLWTHQVVLLVMSDSHELGLVHWHNALLPWVHQALHLHQLCTKTLCELCLQDLWTIHLWCRIHIQAISWHIFQSQHLFPSDCFYLFLFIRQTLDRL